VRCLAACLLAPGPGRLMTSRRCVEAAPAPVPRCCLSLDATHLIVFLEYGSFCITSGNVDGLLAPCNGPIDAGCVPTGRTEQHDQARLLSARETVTAVALGTGQRCHPLRGTTRPHPPGPLLIGRPPLQPTLREAGAPHRRQPSAPASSGALRGSAGAEEAGGSAAARGAAWPGAARRAEKRLRGRGPVRPLCTAAWTAPRSTSVRWMIPGAGAPTWLAGQVPGVINRLMTVALPPNCGAAWLRGNQSLPGGTFGRRYCSRTQATRGARPVFPVPVREPRRLRVAALVTARQTFESSRMSAMLACAVARPCFPAVLRAPRPAVWTPPGQGRCHMGAGGSWVVVIRISCRTVRRRRFLSPSGAAAGGPTGRRSWPRLRQCWRGSSQSGTGRCSSAARGASASCPRASASCQRCARAPATQRFSGAATS